MKKIILTLIAACAFAFTSNAQFYVGGNVGLSLTASNGQNASSWQLAPGFGYKISPCSSVGLDASLGGSSSSFVWSFRPYYRYTFASTSNLHFLLEAGAEFGQIAKSFNWNVGIAPGLLFSATDRIDIVSRIGFLGVSGAGSSTAFVLNILNGSSIGVQFSF